MLQNELRGAPRPKLVAKRKAAYEAVHPETKHGGARRGWSAQVGHSKDRLTADTAAKTGKPERAIRPRARRSSHVYVALEICDALL